MINVGGLTPFTMIDFPGQHSAVIFCQGCPWKCSYCHNSHLLDHSLSSEWSWDRVIAFLKKRVGILDAVVFSGGEPLLQLNLREAMLEVKNLGFKIGLHTGGYNPERLEKVLHLVDWVGFDVKAPWVEYEAITGVPDSGLRAQKSLKLLLSHNIPYETRTTVDPRVISEVSVKTLMKSLGDLGVTHWVRQEARV